MATYWTRRWKRSATIGSRPVHVRVDGRADRAGTSEPVLLPKRETRLGGLSEIIISLYPDGMTVRDIGHRLGG